MRQPTADEIVERAVQRPAAAGRTRLISVDGPAGSGKTTLAAALADGFAGRGPVVATLHMDDFYDGWDGLTPDLERRMLTQVLRPVAAGRPARWQRYDWHAAAFAEWRELPPPDVLILEGCGSGARAYDPYRTLLVWIEAERAVRLRRGIERDGAAMAERWTAWMQAEERHFAANDTQRRADLALRGD